MESEIYKLRNQLVIRCSQYLSSIYQALVGLSREFFNCDLPEHVESETYSTLDSFSRVIIHESMMTPRKDCSYSCQVLNTSTYYRYPFTSFGTWFPQQQCEGYMANCVNLGKARFCELDEDSPIRYSWIESSNWQKTFGTKDQCLNGKDVTIDVSKSDGNECSTCFCECSDLKTGIKTIRLRFQMADIDKNMIVTGLKFEEKQMIFHVQIEQGKLLPGGRIDRSSIHMKELENLNYMKVGKG
ncbi:Protein of unknown function [Cotesia congregata]|uniref:Uncharacterized protein n=1 Tax=Cotesia congregata TaxID=51543 RepID=A0A8J2H478_COTCN|nr:Protein of unknown function [Cotesia congregata]